MTDPSFAGSVNVAMKIPKADYDATVAFYRDHLGMPVSREDASATPSVAVTHTVRFGAVTLWLDRVDAYSQADLWLEVHTDDLDAATQRLGAAGVDPCDEVEPIVGAPFRSHWIKNPAGVVHHLAERTTS